MTLREAEIAWQAAERRLIDLETGNVEIAARMAEAALAGDPVETARAVADYESLPGRLYAAQCDLAGAKIRAFEAERAEIASNPEAADRLKMLAQEIAKARAELRESVLARFRVTPGQIVRRQS